MSTVTRGARSPRFLPRLVRRPLALVCLVALGIVVIVAVVAPLLLPDVLTANAGDLASAGQGPTSAHPLGTDGLGRDVLQRLLVGTGVTVAGVAQALAVALAVGVPLGLLAGYLGGWVDRLVMAVADLTFSTPGIIVVLVVLAVFPQDMTAAMVTFGILASPGLMRVVRSATLPVREEPYIAAARVAGRHTAGILFDHILPRIAGPIIVQASLVAAQALVAQTGLAFLRLVVEAPAPSWGGMVADGMAALYNNPWLIWPSGLAITLTILLMGLLSDAARDVVTEAWSPPVAKGGRPAPASPRIERVLPRIELVEISLAGASESLLVVENLTVAVGAGEDRVRLVEGVTFDVRRGETVGIVGESGCGKTVTAMSILGLLPGGGSVETGSIRLAGTELVGLPERELERIRGKRIGLISQEPMISLDPAFRVGAQLAEAVRRHHRVSRSEARDRVLELLRSVRLPDPAEVASRYPFELSGGMAQRVGIARALAGEPDLLIADEPTTALDVTVQAEILDLLREQGERRGMAILLVTHDWGVVADSCDRAVVMYAGQVVERADIRAVFDAPRHPYTRALLQSNPHTAAGTGRLPAIPGNVPPPGSHPAGCRFQPRCAFATADCAIAAIPLEVVGDGHESRCIHHAALLEEAAVSR
jgi:peptide/nickel transport system permease protein